MTSPTPAGVPAGLGPGPLPPQAPRRRRYTLTPARLRWDRFNLTYRCARGPGEPLRPGRRPNVAPHPRVLSFPRNLLSPSETRRGLAAAFRMWSDVSPFSFREVAPEQPSDIRIGGRRPRRPRPPGRPGPAQPCAPAGFYPANHTDCLASALHHCFDGPTGELAHAFFPPHGGIHFDDSEYWILGPTRYSWKKGDGLGPGSPDSLESRAARREGTGGRGPGSQMLRPRASPHPGGGGAAFLGAELSAWPGPSRGTFLSARSGRPSSTAACMRGRAGAARALTTAPQACGSPTWCTWRRTRSATRWA